jgi:hypothetical protein
MKKILLLTITFLLATYLLSGSYNQKILKYELSRIFSIEISEKDILEKNYFQEIGNEITEFDKDIVILFTYNSDSSLLLNYELNKSQDIYSEIEFYHATYDKSWHDDARLFYTFKEFNLEKKTISTMLKIYHEEGKANKLKLNKLLTDLKIQHVPFRSTRSSLNTKPLFDKITNIERKTNTEGFPLIIVKGKYLIKPWLLESYKDIPVIINYLMKQ